jgi:DNA invertase Pin-like site-specific DNA recombinase
MENLKILQNFGKGQKKIKSGSKNAIIYTRVSSKEQTENLSLEVQLKGCEQFAIKNSLQVKGRFGGTYESAQTDERNEFKRMVNFAKNYKEGIAYIVVYSLERFSRTGENAIWLSRQLRELGITIVSVTQPIDTSNPSGVLQQNILFLFSQYDNDLRRQKCIAGMKEKLMRGEWVGGAPVGYSYDRSDSRVQRIVPNEQGKLIRKAFEMKVHEKLSNTEIAERLWKRGLKLSRKRISEILRNPFYCGFLSHSLLEGQVVKGNHEPIVSEKVFFQANEVIKES